MTVLMMPVVLLMTSCSSGDRAAAPEDTVLRQNTRAGGLAFSLERPEEAITQYERALERARARDDAAAIGDAGYNLAVAQLAANHPEQALASIRMTRAELTRRGAASFPALDLAEATALYRTGAKAAADRLAARAQVGGDPAVAARASFMRGLIADETENVAGLEAALAYLAQPTSADQQADEAELVARRDLRAGRFVAAASDAERAADLRRTRLDYRGMARALAVAADAQKRAGHMQTAADLYMRAGQSAAAQGDPEMARLWLRQAVAVWNDPLMRQAVQQAIAGLAKPSSARSARSIP